MYIYPSELILLLMKNPVVAIILCAIVISGIVFMFYRLSERIPKDISVQLCVGNLVFEITQEAWAMVRFGLLVLIWFTCFLMVYALIHALYYALTS